MHFEVVKLIEAPAQAVWSVITDAKGLTEWDSSITRFEGTIAAGERISLWSEASPGRRFRLRVVRFTAPRQMVWKGGMPFGLFTGRRTYTLVERGGATEFTMREEFSGLMAPLVTRSIPDLTPSFEKYASGLKATVEQEQQS